MTHRKQSTREWVRRLGLVASLAAACLPALPAGADPASSAAIDTTEAATGDEKSIQPPRSTQASAEAQAALRPPAGRAILSRRTQLPGTPSRRSVRAQIESIDPTTWLNHYGTVERRELKPWKGEREGAGCHVGLSKASTETGNTADRP